MKLTTIQNSITPIISQTKVNEKGDMTTAEVKKVEQLAAIDPLLGDAQNQLAALPDVDMARVNAMKAAIRDGKLPVDIDALTRAMQDYYQR